MAGAAPKIPPIHHEAVAAAAAIRVYFAVRRLLSRQAAGVARHVILSQHKLLGAVRAAARENRAALRAQRLAVAAEERVALLALGARTMRRLARPYQEEPAAGDRTLLIPLHLVA